MDEYAIARTVTLFDGKQYSAGKPGSGKKRNCYFNKDHAEQAYRTAVEQQQHDGIPKLVKSIEIVLEGTDGTRESVIMDHTNTETAEVNFRMTGKPTEYRKLLGRIVEEFGSRTAFADAMGISRTELTSKMMGKSGWTKKHMRTACELLHISRSEIGDYFFPDFPAAVETQKMN